MAALSPEQKLFVVTRLACFETPTEIQRALKEEQEFEASLPQLSGYDPSTANGRELSDELKTVFEETRKAFLANVEGIPVAHQAYRLRRLQQLLDNPMVARNPVQVRATLEQAAKEIGGAFTNRRELSGPQGGAIPISIEDAIAKVYGGGDSPGGE